MRVHLLRCLRDAGRALLALGNEQEACQSGIEEHAVEGGVGRAALGHLDRGDRGALEGGLVDGGDRGRQRHCGRVAPGEGARADGGQGVVDAIVGDKLGERQDLRLASALGVRADIRAARQPIGERPGRDGHQSHLPLAHDRVGEPVHREGPDDGLDGLVVAAHELNVGTHAQHPARQVPRQGGGVAGCEARTLGRQAIAILARAGVAGRALAIEDGRERHVHGHLARSLGAVARRLVGLRGGRHRNGRQHKGDENQGQPSQGLGRRVRRGSHCTQLLPL